MRKAYFIFFLAVLAVGSAIFYGRVFSYDTNVAHPYLTERAVNLYNNNSENKISEQETRWITQGAIEEDTPIRWMNHFYNPLTGNGLWGFSSAKDWSRENIKQSLYPKGNQTWQKAIESYAKGDKKEAFIALGHILHLTEDMTVPAHTRDDAHPEGDPYEEWVKSNANKELKIGDVSKLNNINEFFDLLAEYSNKYFLSKDTIDANLLKNLKTKTIFLDNKIIDCIVSFDDNKKEFCIISSDTNFINPEKRIYYFTTINHSDYYSLLAPKAISYGAGVIDLFFQEAGKKMQKNLEKSWLEKLKEKIFSSPQPAGPGFVLSPEPEKPKEAEEQKLFEPEPMPDIGSTAHEPQVSRSPTPSVSEDANPANSGSSNYLPSLPAHPALENAQDLATRVEPLTSNAPPYAGFGGGGASPPAPSPEVNAEDPETVPESEPEPQLPADTTPPNVSLSILECENSLATDSCLLATTTLNIFRSSSAEDLDYFEININGAFSTTTATSTIVFIEDNSSNIFSVRAVDTSGNWSEPQTITVVIYSMPVVINEVAWMGTPANDADEWIELYNRTDYNIDFDNNNWILYSQTDNSPYVKLSGAIPAKGFYLIERKNTGETDEATESPIQDIAADIWTSFSYGLKDTGENLILFYAPIGQASTIIDEVPYCYKWCGGVSNNKNYRFTMERYDTDIPGNDISNWGTNIGLIQNGKNVDGNPINGTPKARNSVNYLIAKGASYISSDITLSKINSPYLVANNFQVFQNDAVLTIEPGVVIKFNGLGMNFIGNAKIIAKGTKSEPIIFTNFYDDEKPEWDIDGIISTSSPGSWYGVEIKTNNQDSVSVFDNVIFRYGGGYTDLAGSRANLYLENNSAKITNSIFEYSKVYGLALVNSNSTVSNNIFRDNNQGFDSAGLAAALVVSGGNSVIEKNNFLENFRGIYVNSAGASIDLNIFRDNKGEAINSIYTPGMIINNSGFDNGINGIVLYGGITNLNSTTTLYANSLPYILDGVIPVMASSTLIIEKDVVVKDGKLLILGTLLAHQGAKISSVIEIMEGGRKEVFDDNL